MTREITPEKLKQRIVARGEFAIIDVREEGVYFDSHLLWATNIPLSRLELETARLLPRKDAPVVVYDSGPRGKEAAARRACQRLGELGYSNVEALSGGTQAWAEAGFELFSGLNVPSKTFGEYLLQRRKPPEILAARLDDRLRAKENLMVLDARPMDEYNAMSIPTAIDVPGAELVYRVFEAAPDEATDIVVNCAGRTRSIVGAMSLINAEIPNRVMLLKDGTMGWHLAGLKLDHGKTAEVSAPGEKNLARARDAANRVAERFDVRCISADELQTWRNDPTRTCYVFDVRTKNEFIERRLAGSIHAPGGQLVQTTDEFIGIRNSRIVLVDDQYVRAVITASWLKQMGEPDAVVLKDPFDGASTECGPDENTALGLVEHSVIEPGELHAVIQSAEPMLVVDLSCSRNYRKRHIAQAHWCVRQHLDSALAFYRPIGLLVLTSEDGQLAHLAAMDISASDPRQLVRVLNGGNQAWRQCGYPMIDGMNNALCNVDDVWDRPYDRENDQELKMKQYLEWEVQLMDQASRDGTTFFTC